MSVLPFITSFKRSYFSPKEKRDCRDSRQSHLYIFQHWYCNQQRLMRTAFNRLLHGTDRCIHPKTNQRSYHRRTPCPQAERTDEHAFTGPRLQITPLQSPYCILAILSWHPATLRRTKARTGNPKFAIHITTLVQPIVLNVDKKPKTCSNAEYGSPVRRIMLQFGVPFILVPQLESRMSPSEGRRTQTAMPVSNRFRTTMDYHLLCQSSLL